jgi:hypothetical protein
MNMRFIGILSAMVACFSMIVLANTASGGNFDLLNSISLNITLQATNETNNSSNITTIANTSSIAIEGNRSAFKLGNLSRPPAKNASDLWYLIQGANHNKVP